MHFPTRGPAAVALMAALANASPVDLAQRTPLLGLGADAKADGSGVSASVSLDVSLQEELLVAGVIADVAVAPVLGAAAAAEVAVLCKNCYVHGNVDASISLKKVVPALSLSLTDIEAYLDLDIQIGAATTIAVNLFTPEDLLKLSLPGLDVEAKVFLDLVLSVQSAIDLSAGVYVELVDEATIDTDLLAGTILDASFSGLSVVTLPVTVRIGCTTLQADLRLRVQAAVGLDLEVDEILPILDIVPDIGAGVEVAVWANLLEYVGLFCDTPECPLGEESYGLNIGAAVGLDVEVEDVATLRLAPTISTALLTVPTSTICDQVPIPSNSLPVSLPAVPTESATLPGGIPTPTKIGDITATGSYPAGLPSVSSILSLTTAAPTLPTAGEGEITSTVSVPKTYTVTTCAAQVANCPPEYQGEKTVIHTVVYTTVCPATATITDLPKPTVSASTTFSKPKPTVTLTPTSCVETFTPPTNVPTPPATASSYPATSASTTAPTTGVPTTSVPSTGVYSTSVPSAGSSSYTVSTPGSLSTTGGVPSTTGYASTTLPAGSESTSCTESETTIVSPTPSTGYPSTSVPTGGESTSCTESETTIVTPTASSGYPGTSPPPYPTTGVPTTGYGNGTTPCETETGSIPQPSASTVYSTTPVVPPVTPVVPPTGGYPTTVPTGGYPTTTSPPIAAGAAGRNAAQGVAGAVVVGALFAML